MYLGGSHRWVPLKIFVVLIDARNLSAIFGDCVFHISTKILQLRIPDFEISLTTFGVL